MSLILLSGPASEPITLAEAKAHLKVDGTSEDALITSLIVTARLHAEAAFGLALITQSWSWRLDCWPPGGVAEVPLRPVQAITRIRVTQSNGTQVTLDPSSYLLDGASLPPRLLPTTTPLEQPGVNGLGIDVELVAGFGAAGAAVPYPIRHALLLLVAHWYECRAPHHVGSPATRIPPEVGALLAPYKVPRL
jgi:uncharacterized phiE125 gp8 family phage protein